MAGNPTSTTRPATPLNAVQDFQAAMAAGDDAGLAGLIAAQNDEERGLRSALANVCGAIGIFGKTLTATFGNDAAKQWGVESPGPMAIPVEVIHGDHATVTLRDSQPNIDLTLIHENGNWRITFDGVAKLMHDRQVDGLVPTDEPLRRMTEIAEAVRRVTTGVKAHQFSTAADAAAAGRQAFADAARGANAQ